MSHGALSLFLLELINLVRPSGLTSTTALATVTIATATEKIQLQIAPLFRPPTNASNARASADATSRAAVVGSKLSQVNVNRRFC